MVCSECGSDGTNKSTCPLLLKNPTSVNWKKHYKAKGKLKKPMPKPKITPQIPFPSKPKPKFIIKHLPKTPTLKPKFINPYIEIASSICESTDSIKNIKVSQGKIIITGNQIVNLKIKVKNAAKLTLKLNNTKNFKEDLFKYMDLFCDIYKRLGDIIITRPTIFTNPDVSTKSILDMVPSITALFIDFLVNNIYPSGGSRTKIDINLPLETILKNEKETLDIIHQLDSLPVVPSTKPILSTKEKEKPKAVALLN